VNLDLNWSPSGHRSDYTTMLGGYFVTYNAVGMKDDTACVEWQLPRIDPPYVAASNLLRNKAGQVAPLTAAGGVPRQLGF
jgi:hypothetical protein